MLQRHPERNQQAGHLCQKRGSGRGGVHQAIYLEEHARASENPETQAVPNFGASQPAERGQAPAEKRKRRGGKADADSERGKKPTGGAGHQALLGEGNDFEEGEAQSPNERSEKQPQTSPRMPARFRRGRPAAFILARKAGDRHGSGRLGGGLVLQPMNQTLKNQPPVRGAE